MSTAVIYTRVSTTGQAEEGVSLDAQLSRARSYAAQQGMEVLGEFCDAGVSGKSVKNRPEFRAALDMACKQKATLVFYSLSRISRSTRDLMEIAERIKRAGAGLASLQEQIDTTTAMGCFLFTILSALCALERELIGERTRTAIRHLRDNGQVYGHTPYGFAATDDGRLVEDPVEQGHLRQMCAWREQGRSTRWCANTLNAAGIPAKNGGTWNQSVVNRVVSKHLKRHAE